MPSRCGRLDAHPPHTWTNPTTRNTFHCRGSVITECSWHLYADQQDAAELEDDLRAEADCG